MTGGCQRWRARRESYRPAGEVFEPSRASVNLIDEGAARRFVTEHHYSCSYPAARLRAGLFVKPAFGDEQLVGVAVFSVPMSQGVIPHHFLGLDPHRGVELGRLVLLDSVAANAESWFVARAFRAARAVLQVDGVLSYSDPVERVSEAGVVVKPGHIGTVYQALNAVYLGRARGGTMILSRDGRIVSRRALSKLRNEESGAGYAYEQLRRLGAPERQPFEDPKAYAERALHQGGFRKVKHPGNHTYAWWLGEQRKRPAWAKQGYPKASTSQIAQFRKLNEMLDCPPVAAALARAQFADQVI